MRHIYRVVKPKLWPNTQLLCLDTAAAYMFATKKMTYIGASFLGAYARCAWKKKTYVTKKSASLLI